MHTHRSDKAHPTLGIKERLGEPTDGLMAPGSQFVVTIIPSTDTAVYWVISSSDRDGQWSTCCWAHEEMENRLVGLSKLQRAVNSHLLAGVIDALKESPEPF